MCLCVVCEKWVVGGGRASFTYVFLTLLCVYLVFVCVAVSNRCWSAELPNLWFGVVPAELQNPRKQAVQKCCQQIKYSYQTLFEMWKSCELLWVILVHMCV